MSDQNSDFVRGVEWFRIFISNHRWQEGKADPSHEYTIRNCLPD